MFMELGKRKFVIVVCSFCFPFVVVVVVYFNSDGILSHILNATKEKEAAPYLLFTLGLYFIYLFNGFHYAKQY